LIPAPVPPAVFEQVLHWSERAHALLGCRGVSRADFRYDPAQGDDGLFILEVNTQPGMTPLSLVPEQAAHCGIGFADLVERLVEDASCDR
ncbi:MAG: D-alanine--D-alanine ligase, partial [Pseudomonadota bacterium]